MSNELWTAVDQVITEALLPDDPVMAEVLAAQKAGGLPDINVAPNQGRLLALLVRATGARRILEVGTLGGYSTIWMARALPDGGRITTLEHSPVHAGVARTNLTVAGVADRVEVVVGAALDTLPSIDPGPYDLAFIDADKEHNADYFAWALRLVRPGGAIIVDNVVRQGDIADPTSTRPATEGVRRLFALMGEEAARGVESTAIQTVGSKGHDGFTLSIVPSGPEG